MRIACDHRKKKDKMDVLPMVSKKQTANKSKTKQALIDNSINLDLMMLCNLVKQLSEQPAFSNISIDRFGYPCNRNDGITFDDLYQILLSKYISIFQ